MANLYREAVAQSLRPNKAIAGELGITVKAAERLVSKARREGLLEPLNGHVPYDSELLRQREAEAIQASQRLLQSRERATQQAEQREVREVIRRQERDLERLHRIPRTRLPVVDIFVGSWV